jgi:hypothetical protein
MYIFCKVSNSNVFSVLRKKKVENDNSVSRARKKPRPGHVMLCVVLGIGPHETWPYQTVPTNIACELAYQCFEDAGAARSSYAA